MGELTTYGLIIIIINHKFFRYQISLNIGIHRKLEGLSLFFRDVIPVIGMSKLRICPMVA
jgi:hypothetical protein